MKGLFHGRFATCWFTFPSSFHVILQHGHSHSTTSSILQVSEWMAACQSTATLERSAQFDVSFTCSSPDISRHHLTSNKCLTALCWARKRAARTGDATTSKQIKVERGWFALAVAVTPNICYCLGVIRVPDDIQSIRLGTRANYCTSSRMRNGRTTARQNQGKSQTIMQRMVKSGTSHL